MLKRSNSFRAWIGRALVVVMLAAPVTACDFVSPTTSDPNAVPEAQLSQLFTTAQLAAWFITETSLSRFGSMWVEQMAGTDRQFVTVGQYIIGEESGDEVWFTLYTGGGLVDIRQAQAQAEARGDNVTLGILQIHEAYLVGTAASAYGAIPYSEAVDPEVETPSLDSQTAVYAAVQALLDTAIGNLQAGGNPTIPEARDMVFQMDTGAWIAVARTLKARYFLHTRDYASAGAQAAMGIMDPANSWLAFHTSSSTEDNSWFEFMQDRSGYISAGSFLVNLLQDANDPRLLFYYEPQNGQVTGSNKENPEPASGLSLIGFGAPDFDFPIVTSWENAFIRAEIAIRNNNAGAAQGFVDDALEDQEAFWASVTGQIAVDIPDAVINDLADVMLEKYKSMFLSIEAWNDYKRTCEPGFDNVFQGRQPVARLPYPGAERQTNPNIPPLAQQPEFNEVDAANLPCPANDFR
ncbi:MAG: SusD/RagB family nutrient-binding outer membrane lipoprotein [Gemmatimonadota bacterium]|nr:SusD/RagB family nutrient-binding outer membrane lipoprotein [Gemmatimonadota bacterium]